MTPWSWSGAGVLRGLSVEMHPQRERQIGGVRSISKATLTGLSVVDSGAFDSSKVEARTEVRQDGEGLSGAFSVQRERPHIR